MTHLFHSFLAGDRSEQTNNTWSAGLNSPPESPPVAMVASPLPSRNASTNNNANKAIINLSSFGNSFSHLAVNPY